MISSQWSRSDRSPLPRSSALVPCSSSLIASLTLSFSFSRPEPILYSFTEIYFTRLEGPIAVQVWSTFIALAREVVASSSPTVSKTQVFPTLRWVSLGSSRQEIESLIALSDTDA